MNFVFKEMCILDVRSHLWHSNRWSMVTCSSRQPDADCSFCWQSWQTHFVLTRNNYVAKFSSRSGKSIWKYGCQTFVQFDTLILVSKIMCLFLNKLCHLGVLQFTINLCYFSFTLQRLLMYMKIYFLLWQKIFNWVWSRLFRYLR